MVGFASVLSLVLLLCVTAVVLFLGSGGVYLCHLFAGLCAVSFAC